LRRLQKKGNAGPEAFIRDMCQCVRCGESDIRVLRLHHIIPKSKGGDNTKDNLETLCSNCHAVHHFMEDMPNTPGNPGI